MSCYHPLFGFPDGKTQNGRIRYRFVSGVDYLEAKEFDSDGILVPCGHCIGCRLDYSRSWADRMMLELETAGKGIFLTLTYRNEDITWCKFDENGFPLLGTLVKRDFQLFMKRLRRAYPERRIRFYAAGEYGDNTFRPHYHAILFGIGLDDVPDLRCHGVNELGQAYYISDSFARIWDLGFVCLSSVSWKTCAYVARYVTKKLNSDLEQQRLDLTGQLRPFSLMSRKPGIGREYLDLHPDCLDFQSINLSTPEGGLQIRIPKYYLRQLNREPTKNFPNVLYDPVRYDKICQERRVLASDSMLLKLEKSDLGFVSMLEAEENSKLRSIKSLRRNVV